MRGNVSRYQITLKRPVKRRLVWLARKRTMPHDLVLRAQIILPAASRHPIAETLLLEGCVFALVAAVVGDAGGINTEIDVSGVAIWDALTKSEARPATGIVPHTRATRLFRSLVRPVITASHNSTRGQYRSNY